MSGFLIDPKIVNEFLDKPYNLKDVWDRVAERGTNVVPVPDAADKFYSSDERLLVEAELDRLYKQLTQGCTAPQVRKSFTLSAGAPGAGKSTLLEELLLKDASLQNAVFSDPDERALKLMGVYKDDIQNFGGDALGLALSYTKWRWASNYISNSIMNRACADQFNVLLGTTATGAAVKFLYDNAHREGYEVTTLIVTAPEDVRVESARRRFEVEQTRFTNDTAEKGHLFYERVPLYFERSNHFKLYWRDAVQGEAVLAATGQGGVVSVHDQSALQSIEEDLQSVRPDLSWDSLSKPYLSP